jgi:hypothetical protein
MRNIGEIVAVYIDDKPSIYARIEDYEADVKPRWFKVKMLFLTFPPQEVTWILREAQVDGEPFTMNNIPVILKTVNSHTGTPEKIKTKTQTPKRSSGKIISLADRARISKDEK